MTKKNLYPFLKFLCGPNISIKTLENVSYAGKIINDLSAWPFQQDLQNFENIFLP